MLTITAHGGDTARKGNYWNFSTGDRLVVDTPGVLPGGKETTYYRIHPAMVVVLAPFLGLAYAIFLPAIGIAMAATALMGKLMGSLAETFSKASVFTWRPSEAYLAGKRKKTAPEKEARDQEVREKAATQDDGSTRE